jgi:hypothetical protein
MRILIISLPRTGSTSLLRKISNERGLKSIFEPFDGSNRNPYRGEDNVVVKSIICQCDTNRELVKGFDEVILLSRKNLTECAESHSYRIHNDKKGFTSLDEYYWEAAPKELYELCYNNVVSWDKELKELSEEIGVPITYYEDIYDTNSSERLRKGNRKDLKSKII